MEKMPFNEAQVNSIEDRNNHEHDMRNKYNESDSIARLSMSASSFYALKKCGVNTISDLMKLDTEIIYNIKNLRKRKEILELQKKFKYGDKSVDDGNYELCMVEVALQDYFNEDSIVVLFKDASGVLVNDIKLEELNLSARATNCMVNAGLDSIRKIAFEKNEDIRAIKNAGVMVYTEIIDKLKEITVVKSTSVENVKGVRSEIIDEIYNLIYLETPDFCEGYINKYDIIKAISEVEITENNQADTLCHVIFESKSLDYKICIYIYDKINDLIVSTKKNLTTMLTNKCITAHKIENCLKRLLDSNRIIYDNNLYSVNYPPFLKWVEDSELREREKLILKLRVKGTTLLECSEQLELTQGRIRQICTRLLSKKPIVSEDKYKYWFETYELNYDTFNQIFGIDKAGYNYLMIMYIKGNKSLDEIKDDPNLNDVYLNAIEKYQYKDSILIGDEYVPSRRANIFKKMIQEIATVNTVTFKDFFEQYNSFLENNHLDKDIFGYTSEGNYETKIMRSNITLCKCGKKFRYYPIKECDIESLVRSLEFGKYNNSKISSLQLFEDNKELMDEYNLQDGFELHNLLKKTKTIWKDIIDEKVTLSRMPYIIIGNPDVL